jgi:hypothetical protein
MQPNSNVSMSEGRTKYTEVLKGRYINQTHTVLTK